VLARVSTWESLVTAALIRHRRRVTQALRGGLARRIGVIRRIWCPLGAQNLHVGRIFRTNLRNSHIRIAGLVCMPAARGVGGA